MIKTKDVGFSTVNQYLKKQWRSRYPANNTGPAAEIKLMSSKVRISF